MQRNEEMMIMLAEERLKWGVQRSVVGRMNSARRSLFVGDVEKGDRWQRRHQKDDVEPTMIEAELEIAQHLRDYFSRQHLEKGKEI